MGLTTVQRYCAACDFMQNVLTIEHNCILLTFSIIFIVYFILSTVTAGHK